MLTAATRSTGAVAITTRQKLAALVGEDEATAITSGLGSSAGQLASLGLVAGLDQLSRGEIDADTFNRRYAHRGPHEFELSAPRPAEDPDWIEQQLAAAGGHRAQPDRAARRQEERAARRLGRGSRPTIRSRRAGSGAGSTAGAGCAGTGS